MKSRPTNSDWRFMTLSEYSDLLGGSMDTSKTPRNTVWEDIKGTLADGQEYWVYRDKPWRTWEEQKDKYAKFADGTVRTFAGFEHLESIEFTTENYLGPARWDGQKL